ncbi:hypothetical protein D9758_008562 [Tetrapyrgos nigripes]|uniref:Major facilitator superfamily (MFS) profile domain-containing protein n=1 Tax=Tetrapyrgos nigripes TaxID=182062 RepID=A0A8H5G606_9AGAR|nr:hypothetical protein D9758_008562 [Tetrapyrgos nigripes]
MIVDEETPLLNKRKPKRTPLPWFQVTIVLFLQLAEPLTSQVIYPFTPQLIRDIGVTNGDETKVGYYVGLMQSLFFFTQALTVMHWSRISDKIGRKPVILTGLFGLSLSMYCFGLSKTFWGLVLRNTRAKFANTIPGSRSLNGALNGNIGVIKSIMAEMTDSTNISLFIRALEFLKKYPYFLPCAVPATFSAVAWIVTFMFLKETVRSPISLSQLFKFRKSKANVTLQTVAASQEPATTTEPANSNDLTKTATIPDDEKPVPLRQLFVPRVFIAAGNYACLSLVDIAYRAIQPLYFSTPVPLGGLGLPPSRIGNILSVFGLLNGVIQIFYFAKFHDRWGSKITYMVGIASTVPIFLTFPILTYLVKTTGEVTTLAWVVVALQILFSILISFSYGAVFIYIQAASPNRASLGATNGLSQMSVSICRAIGPAAANSLYSLSMKHQYLDGYLVYVVLLGTSALALITATLLPRRLQICSPLLCTATRQQEPNKVPPLSTMSESFAAILAMSKAQTEEKQAAVKAMAEERKRKELEQKKRQLEHDKKLREEEARLRKKHFEDQKKEVERQRQREEKTKALEAERQKKQEEQRNALLYGPKKASRYPSSASQDRTREEVRRKRLPSEESDDDAPKGVVMTRQEIRERKLQQQLKREFGSTKRTTPSGGYHRRGRRLPGGAVDVTTAGHPQSSSGSGSVRERLAAMPNTLQPLNQNKRDTRTIDEIVTDLHARGGKKKTIEGEQAKEFDDWFGTKKKEQPTSRVGSTSAPASGSNTPTRSSQSYGSYVHGPSSSSSAQRPSTMIKPIPKLTPSAKASGARPSSVEKIRPDKVPTSKVKAKSSISRPSSAGPSTSRVPSKRPRSPSRSESPYSKRRSYEDYDSEDLDDDDEMDDGRGGSGMSSLIWQIMGKDRSRYVNMDVLSDDEDMEADASAVLREEQRSSRIGKREDAIALAEEKRREEEKRLRKKERERA